MKQFNFPTLFIRRQWEKCKTLPVKAIFASMLISGSAAAQTIHLSPTVNNGGFESGTTGWNFIQNTTSTVDASRWVTGSVPVAKSGSNAAYITTGASGDPWDYDIYGTPRTSHMYRDITFPAGETIVNLSFHWKGEGEMNWDRLMVYIAPTTVTPVSGSPSGNGTAITGATLIWSQPTDYQPSYAQVNITIPVANVGNTTVNSDRRLIFTWKNDDSYGYTPPVAVDDITLTSACNGVVATSATAITVSTASLNWTALTGATGYNVRYRRPGESATVATWAIPTAVTGGTTTTLAVTGLAGSSEYEYQVAATGACATYSASSGFSTACATSPLALNYYHGFNTATLSSCWTSTIVTTASPNPAATYVTTSSHPTGFTPFEGLRMVRFNSWDQDGGVLRLQSPAIATTGMPNGFDVEFDWLHDNFYTSADKVQLQYSTNGTTWTNAGSAVLLNDGVSPNGWTRKTVAMPSGAGNQSTLYVGLLFTSDYGNDCHLDGLVMLPKKPTPTNGIACGTTVPNCSVASNTGATSPSFRWYLVADGGSPIPGETGATLTAYTISATTTFYVSEVIGAAESRRVAVTALGGYPAFSASLTGTVDPVCYNGATGSATVSYTGGAPTYSYSWNTSPVQITATATNLTAGAYTCILTDGNGCKATVNATLNQPAITTLPAIATQPTGSVICAGSNTSFTTAATGLGTITYQWQVNTGSGFSNVPSAAPYTGTTSATLNITAATTAMNGYTYRCVASGTCSPAATTNAVTLTVNALTTTAISIANNTGNIICSGTNVTFTAVATNPGTTPVYQWYVNNVPVGTNATTFTTSTLNNGDIVKCTMASNATCPTPAIAQSNAIQMQVSGVQAASVSIISNAGNPTCAGIPVTFFATPVNGGATPTYTWKKNNVTVGTNSNTYVDNAVANGDAVRCEMTTSFSCAIPTVSTSNTITLSVTPSVVPSLSIVVNPGNVICSATPVSFTATPVNGGSSPVYQWKRNGNNVGTNSSTYNPGTTLLNNDVITCVITSNAVCPVPATATSNAIAMNITTTQTPSVSIVVTPSATTCSTYVQYFTANYSGGGGTPSFQWTLDGQPVGTNSNLYTNTGNIAPGAHTVACVMTSSLTCKSSNTGTGSLGITINPLLVPAVSIVSNKSGDSSCNGSSVTFTATITNGGSSPVRQWKKNGVNVGTNSNTYSAGTTLVSGDVITCELTSNATCKAPSVVTSNAITMTVSPVLTTSVTVVSSTGNTACEGVPTTLTATVVNGGTNPVYQWKKGAINVGMNSPVYADPAIATGSVIKCEVTSNAVCPSPAVATSNSVTFTSYPVVVATCAISVSPDSVTCENKTATFSSHYTNGGTAPKYQWMKNGNALVGDTLSTYVTNSLTDKDAIACLFKSSAICAFPTTSNEISMDIEPGLPLAVEIIGLPVEQGLQFHSKLINGGINPVYQWQKNNADIPGATSDAYLAINPTPTDVFSLFVHSSEKCAVPEYMVSNKLAAYRVTDVKTTAGILSDIQLFPNPNDGKFSIKGKLAVNVAGKDGAIEVLNAVGQVIYKNKLVVSGNSINVAIDLGEAPAAGMYSVRIHVDGATENLRFVIGH